jgi:hypothetical protein
MPVAQRKPPETDGSMVLEMVPMDRLQLDPQNARKGSVPHIVDSLREFGQHRAVVARREDGRIIVGNHLYLAAQTLGWDKIGVYWVEDDDEKAIRRSIADNATGDLAKWDEGLLLSQLQLVGMDVPGVDEALLKKLLRENDTDTPPAPRFPIMTKLDEKYDYVVVVATTETDCAWLHTRFALRKELSYKSANLGVSRVVSVKRLREEWGEVDVPGGQPEEAPAPAEGEAS